MDQLSKLTRDRSNLAFDSATVSLPMHLRQMWWGKASPQHVSSHSVCGCKEQGRSLSHVLNKLASCTQQTCMQADINKLADDFEEQLKASREKLEVRKSRCRDWPRRCWPAIAWNPDCLSALSLHQHASACIHGPVSPTEARGCMTKPVSLVIV